MPTTRFELGPASVRMRYLLITAFVGFILITLLGLGAAAFTLARQTLFDQAVQHLESVATAHANATKTVTRTWLDRLGQIASRTQLRLSLDNWHDTADREHRARIDRIIGDAKASDPEIAWIGITGPDGQLISSTKAPPAGFTQHLEAAHEAGKYGTLLQDILILEPWGVRALMAAPLILDHQLLGVAIMVFDPAELFAIITDNTGLGRTGETVLAKSTAAGDALFMTPIRFDPDSAFMRAIDKDREDVPMTLALQGVERAFVSGVFDYRGEAVVAVTRHLSDQGWGMVVKIDRSEVLAPVTSLRDRLLVSCALIFVVGAALAAFLSKRLAASLADKESQIDAIIDTAVDAIITIDQQGQVMRFNASAEALFGYAEEEMRGQNVRVLMPDDHVGAPDRHLDDDHHAAAAEIVGIGRERSGKRRNGDLFPMELTVGEGSIDRTRFFVISIRDISERKQAETQREKLVEQLQASNRELERSNRELDDFAYIASHDLKEPLRAIQNHATFVLEDYGDRIDDDGTRRLSRMIDLGKRMEQLIADLLYFARLGRGDQAMVAIDPNAVIADISTNLADTLQARNARVVVTDKLPRVSGNPAHVTALFQNLISNGTKYNESEEKIVEIGLAPANQDRAPAGFRTLYIRDNGIGIDDGFQEDVFRIFKRLNSEKAYGPGTGAGLSFVKKIVENHGGDIWLQSEVGEGTTFFLTLKEAA